MTVTIKLTLDVEDYGEMTPEEIHDAYHEMLGECASSVLSHGDAFVQSFTTELMP
jgi:hypothetical protein